jgi:GNAT superfamily N-acetyltransferase
MARRPEPDEAAAVVPVTEAAADGVVELLARAFYDDPTWRWAFPDPARRLDQLRAWWGLYVHAAVPYGHVRMTADGAAAAVWIPPGRAELPQEDEDKVEPLLRALIGSRADDVLALLDVFEANHPHEPPHHYLSLLGTHPDHRGRGEGMRLLATCLREFDEQGVPAYLESSNSANDRRYERLGFVRVGEFPVPGRGAVSCMWREAGGRPSRG